MFFEPEKEVKIKEKRRVISFRPQIEEWTDVLNAARSSLVCINLEKMDESEKQRFIDRVAGGLYVTDGMIHKLTNDVWLLMPEEVQLDTPFIDLD